jgi:hypothetical protein
MTEDDVRRIIKEELEVVFPDEPEGGVLWPILNSLSLILKKLDEAPQTRTRSTTKAQREEGPLYTAVKEFLEKEKGTWFRPGEIVSRSKGTLGKAGPQPVGMVLRRMAGEGIVDVKALPTGQDGYTPKAYRLKEDHA